MQPFYEEKLMNADVKNEAAIEVNKWMKTLIDEINNSDLDSVQIVASLCGAIQAVCMKEKDENNGLAIYKQAIEKLSENMAGDSFFDYFAHAAEWNKALLKDGLKGTKLNKSVSLIGFFK